MTNDHATLVYGPPNQHPETQHIHGHHITCHLNNAGISNIRVYNQHGQIIRWRVTTHTRYVDCTKTPHDEEQS